MKTKTVLVAGLTVVLAACGGADVAVDTSDTTGTTDTAETSLVEETTTTAVPADTTIVDETTTTTEPSVPTSVDKPQPGDLDGAVVVTGIELVIMESEPAQVHLRVSAQLPTPCHEAIWETEDDGSVVSVTLHVKRDADKICADVIQDVELDVDLGDFPAGSSRSVTLNGEPVADFDL